LFKGRVIFNNETPVWVYTEGGKDDGFYNIRLSVEDSAGCKDTITKLRYLFVGGPRADFSFNPKTACIPQVVNFDNSFTSNDVVSKFWDWGNGTTSQVFSNEEVKDRFYNFRYTNLIGRDENNNIAETGIVRPLLIIDDQICDPVIIDRGELRLSELESNFEASNLSLCDSGFIFLFNRSKLFTASGDSLTSYNWSIPRLNFNSTDSVINNLFLRDTGMYTVNFNVRSAFGCNEDTTFNLSVLETPRLDMPPNPTICVGDQYTFSAPGAIFYDWNPKVSIINPNSSTPTVAPIDTTTYYVFFYSNPECPNNDSITINVIRDLKAFAFPDAEICIGDSVQIFASIIVDTSTTNIKPSYLWTPNQEISDNTSPSPFVKPTQDRQYTVRVSYSTCPDGFYTLNIDVGLPASIIANDDKTIIRGESTLLGAIPSNPALPISWRPTETLNDPNILSPLATPERTTTYIVQIKDGACVTEDSMTIFVLDGCDGSAVKVPNAFSPNGDGKNDILKVFGKGIADIKYFRIYNRWGELVHESFDLSQGWDGTYNGKMANPGVYVYYLEAICINGENAIVKGNVTLLR
jgi:gliding motility-associated-like protein